MLAARMHGYKQPLVFEDVKVPEIGSGSKISTDCLLLTKATIRDRQP
jgi:hypothetical protein